MVYGLLRGFFWFPRIRIGQCLKQGVLPRGFFIGESKRTKEKKTGVGREIFGGVI